MNTVKNYLRQQLCPPPTAVIQKWSRYMAAETKLLSQHRAADARLLAEHLSAQSKLLDQHLDARASLLSSFTGQFVDHVPSPVDRFRVYWEYVSRWPRDFPIMFNIFILTMWGLSTVLQATLTPFSLLIGTCTCIYFAIRSTFVARPIPRIYTYPIERIQNYGPTYRPLYVAPPRPRPTTAPSLAVKSIFSSPVGSLKDWYNSLLAPHTHDLTPAASSVVSLLLQFGASAPANNGRFSAAQKQVLNAALAGLSAIAGKVRARDGGEVVLVEREELTVDAGCVVCFAEVVDTVMMPCRHMVVCGTCCNRMGVAEASASGRERVKCPVCRRRVEYTIKVFRG